MPSAKDGRVRGRHAVRRHVGLLHGASAAGVGQTQVDADDELAEALNGAAGGNVVDRFAVQHLVVRRGRHVHDRRTARDRDGFLESADAEVGIQGHRELRRKRNRFAPHHRKPLERKRHDVGAGAQIRNRVTTSAIGHRALRFLDERVAGRFDGHTREHRARRVFHDACDRALGVQGRRQRQRADQRHKHEPHSRCHRSLLVTRETLAWASDRHPSRRDMIFSEISM